MIGLEGSGVASLLKFLKLLLLVGAQSDTRVGRKVNSPHTSWLLGALVVGELEVSRLCRVVQ